MDKEKLEKAANNAYIQADFPDGEYQDLQPFYAEQFKQGAQWLLSQPLSERLTEAEKEDIMRLYSDAKDSAHSFHPEDRAIGNAGINMIENIFGIGLFADQTEG